MNKVLQAKYQNDYTQAEKQKQIRFLKLKKGTTHKNYPRYSSVPLAKKRQSQ